MIIHISGKTRRGKTSLAVAMVMDMLTGVDSERYIEAVHYINNLQKQGKNVSLPPQPHVVSANINIVDQFPNRNAYFVDGRELGLQTDGINTQRFIPYGVYVLDECAQYYNFKELPDYMVRMFEIHGQYFLYFILISHRYLGVNTRIRALVDKFLYVTDCMHTYIINGKKIKQRKYRDDGELVKTVWNYKEFEDESDLVQYLSATSDQKKNIGKNCTYTFNGDIKSHYDPYNFKAAFEDHPNDFSYRTSKPENIDEEIYNAE